MIHLVFSSPDAPWPTEPFVFSQPHESLFPRHRRCKNFRRNLLKKRVALPFIYGKVTGQTNRRDVTLYTQLSPDRLPNLFRILSKWPGPISVAIGGNATAVHEAQDKLRKGHDMLNGRSNIWIHGLIHEMVGNGWRVLV